MPLAGIFVLAKAIFADKIEYPLNLVSVKTICFHINIKYIRTFMTKKLLQVIQTFLHPVFDSVHRIVAYRHTYPTLFSTYHIVIIILIFVHCHKKFFWRYWFILKCIQDRNWNKVSFFDRFDLVRIRNPILLA